MGDPYSTVFGRLAKWTAGHRFLHDAVIHPLMAVTNYWDPIVKLHDYHGFNFSEPGSPGTVGITGAREDVEAVFRALGREEEIEHCHTDGFLCYGTTRYDSPPCDPERTNYRAPLWRRCTYCGGGGWKEGRVGRHPCDRCSGTGRLGRGDDRGDD